MMDPTGNVTTDETEDVHCADEDGVCAMPRLEEAKIEERLAGLDGWTRDGDAIVKTFERGDFVGSVAFVDRLVAPAEEMGHHPDLSVSWDKVTVTLTTHAQGGLTASDFALAKKIDALA
jgi:4a-hydroxytetrahydrobiopterin dehydratase